MSQLEVKNITCKKGDKVLFNKLNFSAQEGEWVAIKGHNGAGKSSLLKILTGLAVPDKGEVFWQAQSIVLNAAYREEFAYLGHKDSLRLGLTAYENILYGLTLANRKFSSSVFSAVIDALALQQVLSLPSSQLSAGQKRKVALATLLLQQKKIWLLDEPYAALDHASSQQLKVFFQQHVKQGGLIIMACHEDDTQAHTVVELNYGTYGLKREQLC